MLSKSDKSADHEMCSSDHIRFHSLRFAGIGSVTTALSGESGAAIWRRNDRDRKRFKPTFCKTSACYSAKVRAVSATRDAGTRLCNRSFLTSVADVAVEFRVVGAGDNPPVHICARIATQ
jgi:hypothetical protein